MKQLSSRPAWADMQAFHLADAPRWIKYLCIGKGVTHYAKRGTGANIEVVAWNKRSIYLIRDSDRR